MLGFLRQVWRRTDKRWLLGGVLGTISSQALVVAQPVALGKMISLFASSLSGHSAEVSPAATLGAFVLLWLGASTLQALSELCNAFVMQELRVVGKRVAFSLLLRKEDRSFFAARPAGSLEVLVSTASMCCRGIYQDLANSLIRLLALTVFASIALGFYDFRLSVVFAAWLACFIVLCASSRFNRAPALAGAAVDATSRVGGFILDVLRNIDLVQASGEQANECRKLDALLNAERRLYLRGQLEVERAMVVKRSFLFLLVAAIAAVVAWDVHAGRIPLTGVPVVMVIAWMLAYQFDALGKSVLSLQEYLSRLDQSLSALAMGTEDAGQERAHGIVAQQPSEGVFPIECVDVAFAYPGQAPLYTGLNLRIDAGDRIGIIGPSGSGKSTLLHLLRGEWAPIRGAVRSAGVDLARLPAGLLRASVAYVSQETAILHRSLRENLLYGVHRRVDDDTLIGLLHSLGLGCLQGSAGVDLGLCVGEHGARISGGERQRIGLIRALLRDVRLILLDEPTSALDPANEQLVARFIERLPSDRAVVVVSHQRGLLGSLDRVYLVEHGSMHRVAGAGHHPISTIDPCLEPGMGGKSRSLA
jgi:ATP-binding cassette subfamily B protein